MLLSDLHVEGAGDTGSGEESRDVDVNEAGDKEVLWPLLAAVKCRKPAVVVALVERHHVRARCDARGRSELHALAESQRGPFPPLPVRLCSLSFPCQGLHCCAACRTLIGGDR